MRIISGKFKGRRLDLPKNFKARPTTDFAKENLFNILENYLDWKNTVALDLFGGTGSISFELISRGSLQVTCIEKYAPNYSFIKQTKQLLEVDNLEIYKTDSFKYVSSCKKQYDFIFADPPYDLTDLEKIPQLILENNLIAKNGMMVMEHSKNYSFDQLDHYKEKREYGSVNFSFFIND